MFDLSTTYEGPISDAYHSIRPSRLSSFHQNSDHDKIVGSMSNIHCERT